MKIVPLTLWQANDFVELHHRHSARTSNDGGKFAVGLEHDGLLVGVAIVGRPIARLLQQHLEYPAELLRLCTSSDCPKGGDSKLYTRAKRIWQLMGGVHFHTYTLQCESGASMRGAGLKAPAAKIGGAQWDRNERPRDHQDIFDEPKFRWDETLTAIPLERSAPSVEGEPS